MIDPNWLFTDPVPTRTKGWSPKSGGGVKIRKQWAEPEIGAGADVFDSGGGGTAILDAPTGSDTLTQPIPRPVPPAEPAVSDPAEASPPVAAPLQPESPSPTPARARTPAPTGTGEPVSGGTAGALPVSTGNAGPSSEPVMYRPPPGDPNLVPNQFGDKSLSAAEAASACGPAAAVAFARANGRNPTLREATTLASQRQLWDTGGMHGPAAEVQLMRLMGVSAAIGSDREDNIQESLNRGDPVSISTANHYFVADQYNPANGTYHVGNSGTAFRVGSPWMTMAQIRTLGGGVNGVIYADHPLGDQTPYPDTHPLGQERAQPIPSTPDTTPQTQPKTALPARSKAGPQQPVFSPAHPSGQVAASVDDPVALSNSFGITDQMVEQYADQHGVSWDEARTQMNEQMQQGVGAGADEFDAGSGSDPTPSPVASIHDDTPWHIPVPADNADRQTQQPVLPTPDAPVTAPLQAKPAASLHDEEPWHISIPDIAGAAGDAVSALGSAAHGAVDAVSSAAQAVPAAVSSFATGQGDVSDPAAVQAAQQGTQNAQPNSTYTPDPTKPHDIQHDPAGTLGGMLPQVDLPPPDAGSPLAKSLEPGAPAMSGPERLVSGGQALMGYEAAREQATENINPLKDVPVVGGIINQATDPASWFPMGEAENAVKAVAGAAKENVPKAVEAAVEHLWDPISTTYNKAWDTIMPEAVASQLPANVATRFAASVGAGAASSAIMAHETDPNDPNYWAKVIGAGGVGLVGSHVAMHVTPEVVSTFNKIFQPVMNLKNKRVIQSVATRANQLNGASGENWLWRNRIEEVLGKPGKGDNTLAFQMFVEENGHAPPGSSPQVQALVTDMLKYAQDTGDEGRRLGYIHGEVTGNVQSGPGMANREVKGYLPRVLEKQTAISKNPANNGVWHGKLDPKGDYSHMREHTFLRDAVAAGVKYDNSVSGAFGHYAEHVNASRANALFLKDLKKVAPETVVRIGSPKNVSNIGSGDWIWGGNYMKQWQNVAFSPELKTVLDNITSPSRVRNAPIAGGVLNLMSEAKHALFAPSLFHLVNEQRQVFNAAGFKGIPTLGKSLHYAVHPGARRKFWADPQTIDLAREAMNSGLIMMRGMPDAPQTGMNKLQSGAVHAGWGAVGGGLSGGFTAHQDPTQTDQDVLHRAIAGAFVGAAGGAAGGAMSKALWEGAMPVMKLQTWSLLKPALGGENAAKYVNSVYGGQNLEALARSKTVQDVLRMGVLAPDWQESWIRQIGSALMPGSVRGSIPGLGSPTNIADANRQYWLRAAAGSALMLEGFNVALNGHGSQDNGKGHELTLETTGLYDKMGWDHTDQSTGEKYRTYVDLLGPYRGMLNAPSDPGKFAAARVGLLPSELSTFSTNKDWRGKDIASPTEDPLKSVAIRAAYMLSRLAPVGPSEVMRTAGQTGEPLAVTAGQAVVGLRETRMSPLQEKVQARNDAWTKVGFTQEQEQQFNASYLGAIRVAENDTTQAFARGVSDQTATHQAIMTEAQRVNWPTRDKSLQAWEPTDVANDPVKNADFVAFLKSQGAIGTQSSENSADIKPEDLGGTTVDAVKALYWNPPGKSVQEMASLPQAGQDRIREQVIVQQALTAGVDPNSLRDAIKASEQGTPLAQLPGISSATLDQWVSQYRGTTDADPVLQGEARRKVIDQIAAEHNIDPAAVYARIKLRGLPIRKEDPNEPGIPPAESKRRELQTSYERAQDALFASRDPATYPKYAGPDGKPYKGSGTQQWSDFDKQIAEDTKAGKKTHTPEIQALLDARDAGAAKRLKSFYGTPGGTDYERWYGVGRNMDEKQWTEYTTGRGTQFTDINNPTENRRRTRTVELWKATAPSERKKVQVAINVVINGKVQQETTTLELAKQHIEKFKDPRWKVDWGLDSTGSSVQQSGGAP